MKALFFFGPTASGKTEALRQWKLPGQEVISADSMKVYRGFDIGTAKAADTHHLIDIRNPDEQFNVAEFVHLADEIISDVLSRGGIPVVSGGNAFYLKHLWYGLPNSPPVSEDIRSQLQERCKREGLEVLRRELAEVDPESEQRILVNDAYRVIRALEVYKQSGRPLSSYSFPDKPRSDLQVLAFGIRLEKGVLYKRINERVEKMFKAGLVDEVRGLIRQGYGMEDPAMRAIGYREFLSPDIRPLLLGSLPLPSGIEQKLIVSIQKSSWNYAKRQLTFFRKMEDVQWMDPRDLPTVLPRIRQFFGAS